MNSRNDEVVNIELLARSGLPLKHVQEWQSFLNSIAKSLHISVCVIMYLEGDQLTLLAKNDSNNNPFSIHSVLHLGEGKHYCEQIIKTKKPLFVRDASQDARWKDSIAANGNMLNYLGFPIFWPNGEVLGTLCILNSEVRDFKEVEQDLMMNFSRIIQSHVQLIYETQSLEDSYEDLQTVASTDQLTRIPNRRAFFEQAKKEIDRAIRYQHTLSLLMIDLDHFKRFNDEFGHDKGDKVLRLFAKETKKLIRTSDIFARIGGEEFAILMPETRLDDAYNFAERLRLHIAELPIHYENKKCQLTISIGLVESSSKKMTINTLLKKADELLYQAKQSGRNKTCK